VSDSLVQRIQTSDGTVGGFRALSEGYRAIHSEFGIRGFWRGAGARALYFMPSAAIVWSTYEIVKEVFGVELQEGDDMLPI
jgi:hypothetical protein